MLDTAFKEQLRQIFAGLEADYVFDIAVHPQHESRNELIELLEDTASCSDKISCTVRESEGLEFRILRNGEDLRICFQAVPNGHEFSSLLLAVLNADGKGKNLPDDATRRRIECLQGNATVTTYMSLSCTNCPDVVQAINVMTLLNPRLSHRIVDGALHENEVQQLKIQAVPSVWLKLVFTGLFGRRKTLIRFGVGDDDVGVGGQGALEFEKAPAVGLFDHVVCV